MLIMRPLRKDHPVNAKVAKTIVKGVASVAFACLMGQTYKLSKVVDDRIDDYFAEEEPEKTQQDTTN